ncbi:MAG: glycosyltransferase family 39 protein [Pirellulales bacterium]|nr:glycosyltransferase family 39 protein [Pirellulales bacterium]
MALLEQFVSILTLATLILAAYGAGRPAVRGLRVAEGDTLTATVWSLAVGLVIWGSALAVLGLAGGLSRPLIVTVSLAAAFWGLIEVALVYLKAVERRTEPAASDVDDDVSPGGTVPAWLKRGVLILAIVAVTGSLIGALAPPTAGDALCYHLELPKRFLEAGSLVYLPYHDNSTFPLLVEMWYLWALALGNAVTAQLMHWAVGVLFALATVVLARPILGRRWAVLAGAVAVLTPGVNNQMTAPMNDVALAVFAALCLAAWWRAVVDDEGFGWLILSGVAAGGALATKYLAMVFGVGVAVSWLWMLARRRDRRRLLLGGAAVVAVVAAGVSGLWYVRAAWHRGNPVYPFFSQAFANGQLGAETVATLPEGKSPLGRGPVGLLTAPWQLTMHPERFDDRGHQLGVLFLAVLPGLCLARRLRGLGTLLVVGAVYVVVWYFLRQYSRFLFPVVPILSVAVVWVWMEMRRFPRGALACAIGVQAVILAVFAFNSMDRSKQALAVAIGVESREDYLTRCEPTFGVATLANLMLRPGERILSQDCRLFYFDAPIMQEKVFRRARHYERAVTEPGDLSRVLRQAGFTHLLLAENNSARGERFDSTLARLAQQDPTTEPLVRCRAMDADGAVRCYRLVKLGDQYPVSASRRETERHVSRRADTHLR